MLNKLRVRSIFVWGTQALSDMHVKSLSFWASHVCHDGTWDTAYQVYAQYFHPKLRFVRIFYVNSSSTSSLRDRGEYVGSADSIVLSKEIINVLFVRLSYSETDVTAKSLDEANNY
jgi:hypothetical protein